MKVTAVKTFLVHPGTSKNWLFVKVETDAGLHGWGEAYTQADRDRALEIHVQELGRYLVGRSPFNIKHFTFGAYTQYLSNKSYGLTKRASWLRPMSVLWSFEEKL